MKTVRLPGASRTMARMELWERRAHAEAVAKFLAVFMYIVERQRTPVYTYSVSYLFNHIMGERMMRFEERLGRRKPLAGLMIREALEALGGVRLRGKPWAIIVDRDAFLDGVLGGADDEEDWGQEE